MHTGENPRSVSAPTMASHIRRSVIEDLHSGSLVPGMSVDEQSLCERFKTSRTPVREAMLQLANEGFLAAGQRSGVVVPKLSVSRLREILETLAEMEAAAAKFATRRMTSVLAKELRLAFERCEAASKSADALTYRDANDAFHAVIYKAAHNELLINQIGMLRTRCAAYTRDRFDSPGRIQLSLEEHRHLLREIESGDPARGHAAMLEHISIGGRDFAEFVSRLPAQYISSD